MKSRAAASQERRQPSQQRSRRTVEAVLDAVARVLKRNGAEGVTTNRIAEAAGVSIGSVYQYFPDKQAIFLALPSAISTRWVESSRAGWSSRPRSRSTTSWAGSWMR